ncbi:hypothetical protein F9288_08380 [Sphingomonas sp. CL5.1]|uniref:hypothetical protein n=1 Tax=Sphingomonas sp. CL5.1 TaxID=2653203 RepID=UPI001581CE9D|nr:hypothetical protein [Sphingomonas sp. CL5.1]QKR99657.1 hypothetical protein F9288_08380 [Sphingomonas sp. CL5.1]
MDGNANRRAGNREYYQRRAKQAHEVADAAADPHTRRLHLAMAGQHEQRAALKD